jgi:hypothetical protein
MINHINPFVLFPGGGADKWDVSDLSTPPTIWLDASDIDWKTGAVQDYLTLSSGEITDWDDRSGNGNDFIQGTPANNPSGTGVLNSQRTTEWDGGNSWLTCVNAISEIYTLAAVVHYDDATFSSYNGIISLSGAEIGLIGNIGSAQFYGSTFNNSADLRKVNGETMAGGGMPISGANNILVWHHDPSHTFTSGYPIIGSDRGFSGRSWKGDIAEIIIIQDSLTTDQRQKIEGYLAHKWGLTGNLDSGHPYKSVAP